MNKPVIAYSERPVYNDEDIHPECREMYNLVKPILYAPRQVLTRAGMPKCYIDQVLKENSVEVSETVVDKPEGL